MSRDRTIRRPRNPALFWATAAVCGLIAASSIAAIAVRAEDSGRAEAAVEG